MSNLLCRTSGAYLTLSPLRYSIISLMLIACSFATQAQNSMARTLTLDEVIGIAQGKSPDAKRASTLLSNRYWSWRTYRSNYLPQLRLSGELPNLDRSISSITQDDGRDLFIERSQASSSMDLSLSQNIGLTGGEISIGSSLQRIDFLSDTNNSNYLANPAVINFRQPLFGFNSLRWDRKIEPLRYEESKREFNESMEDVAIRATTLFFNLLVAQQTHKIAEKNLANNDTLFIIAKGRYNLGKIAENELLQMELSVMNSRNDLAQAELDIRQANLELAIFLGMTGNEVLTLIPPTKVPEITVEPEFALVQAKAHRKDIIAFSRQKLEAERDVAQARGENGLNLNLFGSYGLTKSTEVLDNVLENPNDQQRVRLGFDIPLLDWGQSRARVKTAMANKDLTDLNVQQDELNFRQEILLLVNQYDMQRQRLIIAEKADTVAQKRYFITQKRYKVGKIDILDLNIALNEKDQARQSYFNSLRTYWLTFYELRKKTLYDFENMREITY